MTLIFENDLDSAKLNQHATYLGQRSFSSKRYCPHAQTHTPDRLLHLDH